MDLTAGFVHSQILQAVVALDLLEHLADGPRSVGQLAVMSGLSEARMRRLCRAAVALDLLKFRSKDRVALARLGAALRGVPGLPEMILHHNILYRDLADPVGFFRGETSPELADFWPYVFGQGAEIDGAQAERYSALMAQSQSLVAEETLQVVSLSGAEHLLDIGGGTGAFLAAVGQKYPALSVTLFDLPEVSSAAAARFVKSGMRERSTVVAGNFQVDPLPAGADAISLIRVLYDHETATVRRLLSQIFEALPPNGRLLISEPMSGGDAPHRAGDAYFAIYCMAMGTGTVRSPAEITRLLTDAGFTSIDVPRMRRRFITQTIVARKPL